MNVLSCTYNSRKDNYVFYYSALLVFAVSTIIPIELHLIRFSFLVTCILFAVGFFSLFMVARNQEVGFGLLKFLKIQSSPKNSVRSWQRVNTYENLTIPRKIQDEPNLANDLEAPLLLLQNFVKEISKMHEEQMDWATLDSFHMLKTRVDELVVNTNDE